MWFTVRWAQISWDETIELWVDFFSCYDRDDLGRNKSVISPPVRQMSERRLVLVERGVGHERRERRAHERRGGRATQRGRVGRGRAQPTRLAYIHTDITQWLLAGLMGILKCLILDKLSLMYVGFKGYKKEQLILIYTDITQWLLSGLMGMLSVWLSKNLVWSISDIMFV